MGTLIDRAHREFSEEEIDKIAATYHAWRLSAPACAVHVDRCGNAQAGGEKDAGEYGDVPGFCKSATTDEIKGHGYVLTPGRYVGAAEIEDDGIPFEKKMVELAATLYEQFAQTDQLEATIRKNLEVLGYGG